MNGLVVLLLALSTVVAQAQDEARHGPVHTVAPGRLEIETPQGMGQLPIYVSQDWSRPLPEVTRVVLVFHGLLRDADGYFDKAKQEQAAAGAAGAGAMMIVPQFLTNEDVAAFALPATVLHWAGNAWSDGEAARGPVPASSFDAIDFVLARLADPARFVNLRDVVLAGHSAGGQLVQRYAVVTKGEAPLLRRGIHIRYVVANPSSYLYFTDERPGADGTMGPFAGVKACPRYDRWKYGMAGGAPAYVAASPAILEAAYAERDVVYLLGGADTDPNHRLLDKSCAGEAEGATRLARGEAYFALMQARHGPALKQRLFEIPGVGHQEGRMFGSVCGRAALFDTPGCQ